MSTKETKEGYIYCLYNEVYNYYGDNVYKIGETNNIEKRMRSYTTSYIYPSEFKIQSEKICDSMLAEKLVFYYLKDYRIESNREFFQCELSIIKEKFDTILDIFKKNTLDDIIKMYNNMIEEDIEVSSKSTILDENRIDEILKAQNDIKNNVAIGITKEKKRDINYVKNILETFKLDTITKEFLYELEDLKNVDGYKNTIAYLMNNYANSKSNNANSCCIIKRFFELYWKNGISNNEIIKIFSERDNLTIEQNEFFTNHETEMRFLFSSLRRKANPKNQFQLLGWLKCMLNDFFGNYIDINISPRYQIRKSDTIYNYYMCNIIRSKKIIFKEEKSKEILICLSKIKYSK